ncbi:MAG: phage major capsid protein [Candidatus Marinimicrobia bacterium]|nr:phage major capsid protein [Candidatus Neomarinimicrobiota bacterium]
MTLSDLQYILNTFSPKGYQKAFNNKAPFFGHLRIKPGKGKIGVKYHHSKNTSGGSFSEGDDLSTAGKQLRRELTFPWKQVYKTINVSGLSEAVALNGGVKDIKDMVKQELMDATEDLIKEINDQLLGDGTGNSGADIQGLKYHIEDSGNYAEQALDRATYTWLKSYINDNGGVNRDLTKVLIDNVHNTLVDTRGVNYNQVWTSSTVAGAYEALLGDKVRYTKINIGDLFFDALLIHGRPVIPFPGYPANRMDFVEADGFEVQYLPVESRDSLGRVAKNGMFKVKELSTVKDATVAAVISYMNLVCKNVYHAGSLQDVE